MTTSTQQKQLKEKTLLKPSAAGWSFVLKLLMSVFCTLISYEESVYITIYTA